MTSPVVLRDCVALILWQCTHGSLNGVGLPVTFAGLVAGQIGVYQISVTVPRSTPLGLSVPLTITQGGQSQTVKVRVVN
jgi:uncharacterized protein (TIGR03437 family)